MKRFAEQLQKKSQTVRMSAAERRELHARLISYIEYHPLPQAQKNTETYLESESVFSFFNFNTAHIRGFTAMFAVFLLIIVPVIAEKSVPGDVLYPVKLHFTEEIRSTLAVSPYAKIELETRLLERRIAEARLLASEGKLTAEVEGEVARAVKSHSDAAQNEIAALRVSDSDEAAMAEIAFGSALSVQSEVLEGALKKVSQASGEVAVEGTPVTALALAVETARMGVEESQNKQNPSYEKMMARIESESTRAYELFEDVKRVATPEEVSDVERRLSDVERKITYAVEAHAEGEAVHASSTEATPRSDVALLRTALSDLQKLVSFMTYIDVRENVTVDALVPVTLTDDEIKKELQITHAAIDERVLFIEKLLAADSTITETEKIELGLSQVIELASTSKAAIEAGELSQAQSAVTEAVAYLDDIEKIIVISDIVPEPPEKKATSTDAVESSDEETSMGETGTGELDEKS